MQDYGLKSNSDEKIINIIFTKMNTGSLQVLKCSTSSDPNYNTKSDSQVNAPRHFLLRWCSNQDLG
jgi:hypothetical protein